MANREKIAIGEYYHVYNRGVDKRNIVSDEHDSERFIECLRYFNSKFPIRSIRDLTSDDKEAILRDKENYIVEIVCFCLNPNHYHLLLKEVVEGGISEFMKRVGGGYTWYFNSRHGRSGALFQGTFKSVRVVSNEQLLHVSSYINLNDMIHKYSGLTAGLVRSSWNEYIGSRSDDMKLCNKTIILEQFGSVKKYERFAKSTADQVSELKLSKREIPEILIGQHFFE